MKELEGNEGPEAEQEIAQLLAANEPNPNRNGDKPDSENEDIDVVKKVKKEKDNLPLAPAGEPPKDTTAPSDKAKGKKARTGRGKGRA